MFEQLFGLQEEVFKMIASRKRLELIQLLHGRELSVNEMAEMLGIRQANVSQHLSELRQAKIVTTRRDGVKVFYKLTDERISQACSLIKSFLQDQYQLDPTTLKLMQDEAAIFPGVKDVVCGMRISLHYAGASSSWDGETYYFCGSGCKQKFDAAPETYITKKEGHNG